MDDAQGGLCDGYAGLGASFKNFPMMMDNLPSDYELVILEEHDVRRRCWGTL